MGGGGPAASEVAAASAGGGQMEETGYARAEGPVMMMMSKRLRALRKKANRISQIEESKVSGKVINKEQEEMLRSKTSVMLLIDEYEKLRTPLQASVKEEVAEAEKVFLTQALQQRSTAAAAESEGNVQGEQKGEGEGVEENGIPRSEAGGEAADGRKVEESREGLSEVYAAGNAASGGKGIDGLDLVKLIEMLYFGALFDVKTAEGSGHPGSEAEVLRWRREQERNSCLSYDVVSDDDATPPLTEQDLDAISMLSRLLTSRSPNAGNHKEAIERCLQHATKWLQGVEEPISDSLQLSYAQVKDRLRRIVLSEFFTRSVLDVNAEVAAAAAASGQFVSEALPEVQSTGDQAGAPQYYSAPPFTEYVVAGQDHGLPEGTAEHMLVSPVTNFVPQGGFTVVDSQVHLQYPGHESMSSNISTHPGDVQQQQLERGYLPNGVQYADPTVVEGLQQSHPHQVQPPHIAHQQQPPPQAEGAMHGAGNHQYTGASRGPMGGRLQNNPGRGYGGRMRGGRGGRGSLVTHSLSRFRTSTLSRSAAMACAAACSVAVPVTGLAGSSLSVRSNVQLKSAFVSGSGARFSGVQLERTAGAARVTCFSPNWLRKDLSVVGFGLIGWLAPSSIPAINGESLTGLFFGSIGPELAKFPVGPSLDSPFWLWMILWHTGLFIALLLGQVGFKGRGDGYFG